MAGHTIETLRELFDEKLAARDMAVGLQAVETRRRLDELNHEHARVAQAQQTYVSKDTWEGYVKADIAWKGNADLALHAMIPRSEFQAYKDTTEKALTLKAGQSSGRGDVMGWIVAAITSVAAIAAIFVAVQALHGIH